MAYDTIKIGSHIVPKIEYKDVQAGDFVCTYEALTTRPDLLNLQSVFRNASLVERPQLNKMFHTEIILKKYPRIGMYEIAHADGGSRKVISQDDNFKEHHPGQAFIIFRAKNKAIQKEIVKIATKTAEPNNGHICTTFNLSNIPRRIHKAIKSFIFENFGKKASNKTLLDLSCKVLNFNKTGKFYGPNISKTMSCIEYVANVINVASIRVLTKQSLHEEKECDQAELFQLFKKINENGSYPLKYSHPDATSPAFVDYFLNGTQEFETVGYLGTISDPLEGSCLDLKGDSIQISPDIAKILILGQNTHQTGWESLYAAKVMKTLGMLNDSWTINSIAAKDLVKIKTLLTCIHAKLEGLLAYNTSVPNLQFQADSFVQRFSEFINEAEAKQAGTVQNFPEIPALKEEEIKQILLLEKKIVNSSSIERTERTLKISINVLLSELSEIPRIKKAAQRCFNAGKAALKTIILAPLYFGFYSVGKHLNQKAEIKEKNCSQMLNDILVAHEKIRKNGQIFLSDKIDLPHEYRPWIHYSFDGEKSWNIEPFIKEHNYWNANFHIPTHKNITYKVFVGPEDLNDPDPLGKSCAQTELTLVPFQDFKVTVSDGVESLQFPPCNPTWSKRKHHLSLSAHSLEFQEKCNAIGPTENWPGTIQEYEDCYTSIESHIKPATVSDTYTEEEILENLKSFIKTEIGLEIPSAQIQFKTGGLGNGLSGDRIYIVSDASNDPQFIIKVFANSGGKFSREFMSLMNHRNLNLKKIAFPEVLGIGATKMQKNLYFMALDYIPGLTVYNIFKNASKLPIDSLERKKSIEKLVHIYTKLGEGIAEFHLSSKNDPHPLHPVIKNLFNAFSKNAFLKFEKHLEPAFVEKLRVFFEKHYAEQSTKPLVRGYYHGDLNNGNMIYNPITDRLSIIDWPDGSFAIGKDGTSLGIPFHDIVQIKNELLNMEMEGITREESSQIFNAFNDAYTGNGMVLPPQKTMNFFSSIDLMGSLKWFIDKNAGFQPKELEIAKKIFQIKLETLESIVNKDI